MSGSDRHPDRESGLDRRLAEVRRLMRERHAGVEPSPDFASRVAAQLPERGDSPLAWAAWRLLPLSIALLAALLVAAAVREPASAPSATATVASAASGELDALSWLLADGEEAR